MSEKSSIATSAEAEGGTAIPAVTAPVSPTVTHYRQLAAAVMSAIDDMSTVIPQLEVRHVSTAKFARTHVNVSNEFLDTTITAVEQTPDLQLIRKLDVMVGRDTLQFLEAFRPVFDKVTAFQKNLKLTMMSKKADLVTATLQVYDIAKGMARDASDPALSSHVENMSRDLNRSGPTKAARKKKEAAAAMLAKTV